MFDLEEFAKGMREEKALVRVYALPMALTDNRTGEKECITFYRLSDALQVWEKEYLWRMGYDVQAADTDEYVEVKNLQEVFDMCAARHAPTAGNAGDWH